MLRGPREVLVLDLSVLKHRLELPGLVQLGDDVATPDKLPLHEHLRNRRPLSANEDMYIICNNSLYVSGILYSKYTHCIHQKCIVFCLSYMHQVHVVDVYQVFCFSNQAFFVSHVI